MGFGNVKATNVLGKIIGEPEYIAKHTNKDVSEPNTATTTSSSMASDTSKPPVISNTTTEDIFEEENNLLSQIPDELLNISVEKLTKDNEKQKLLKLWNQDLETLKIDKQIILCENKSIITEFKILQSKKKEIENAIAENKNNLIPIEAGINAIEDAINEKHAEIKNFLKNHFPEQL